MPPLITGCIRKKLAPEVTITWGAGKELLLSPRRLSPRQDGTSLLQLPSADLAIPSLFHCCLLRGAPARCCQDSPSPTHRAPNQAWERLGGHADATPRAAQKPRGPLFLNLCHLEQKCPLSLTNSTYVGRKSPWHRCYCVTQKAGSDAEQRTRRPRRAFPMPSLRQARPLCRAGGCHLRWVLVRDDQPGGRAHSRCFRRDQPERIATSH